MDNKKLKKVMPLLMLIFSTMIICTTIYAKPVETIKYISTARFGNIILTESGKAIYQGSANDFNKQPGFKDFTTVENGGTVILPGTWQSIGANSFTFYGVRSDGSMWATGFNDVGQIGNGTKINQARLVQIGTQRKWKSVTGTYGGAMAVATDGTLWGWGLLKGTTVPTQIGKANDWQEVYNGMALKKDGSLWGELGKEKIYSGKDYQKIVKGDGHYLMLKKDGSLWGKGNNHAKQLGNLRANVSYDDHVYKDFVRLGNDKWLDIDAAGEASFGIKTDGSLWSWGGDSCFVLGLEVKYDDPKKPPYLISDQVKFKRFPILEHGSEVAFMFAIDENDFVYGWGNNGNGQVTPDIRDVRIPTKISFINNQFKGITLEEAGREYYFEREILQEKGSLLVPTKLLTDKYGMDITYDPVSKSGSITNDDQTLAFTIDNRQIKINDQVEQMVLPAKLENGSTYIPASAINKYFGNPIEYNAKDKKIILSSPITVSNMEKDKFYLAENILDRNTEVSKMTSWMYNPYTWETVYRTYIKLMRGDAGQAISPNGPVLEEVTWLDDSQSHIGLTFKHEFVYRPQLFVFNKGKIVGEPIESIRAFYNEDDSITYVFSDAQRFREGAQIGIFLLGQPYVFIVDSPNQIRYDERLKW